jgi:P-type Mg2+ transporter
MRTTSSGEFTYRHARRIFRAAQKGPEELFHSLRTSRNGLSDSEVSKRRKRHGINEVAGEEKSSARKLAVKAFKNPFNYLISSLALVSYLTDDLKGAILMLTMVVLSVITTFLQELRSSRAAERLREMVSTNVTVTRSSPTPEKKEIPIVELVPGDIVHLSAGDMVPADIRLVQSKLLAVSQSALTGESMPVEKFSGNDDSAPKTLPELKNVCFMGSNVVSGSALAVVLQTGQATYFGSIARSILGSRVETSFDKGIKAFTHLMLRFMMVMVPLVFLINGLTKGNWADAFLFAIAVAVGLTPEMLPMIVTVNLAKGALAMSRKKVIIKRLNAIQNFGAMDILCTDKTGTLTEDLVIFGGAYDPFGNESAEVLRLACVNSYFQTGLRNFLDIALIKHAEATKINVTEDFHLLDEIPFDFSRKRMSVLVSNEEGKLFLICKGAVEEVLSFCRLSLEERNKFHDTAKQLNDRGLRLLAIASKEMSQGSHTCELADEKELTLVGYIAFLDPPTKDSAAAAVQALSKYGITCKILTGDNERVTEKVAKEVGLPVTGTLLGPQIVAMSDDELRVNVLKANIFAKLTPDQKQRIIEAFRAGGHVVGFIGDGINDAPALNAADVGISVNNAVDIAKESADIILLEKSLLVLEEGVVEGRKVFGNIIKYIKMGASSNFGNVFSMLGASSFLPFLPLRPVQMLTQNLLYDFSQVAIPLDRVDEDYIFTPRKWEIGDITKFMLTMGPVSSLFDYLTFAVMWFYFRANHPGAQSLFQTGWFVEGLLSQTLIVHMIRTRKIPFFQSRASWPLLMTTAIVMAIGIWLPFSLIGKNLGFVPLPGKYFVWLLALLLSYCALTQVAKNWFIRRYGYN